MIGILLVVLSGVLMFFYMYYRAHHDHLEVHELTDAAYTADKPMSIFFISDIHNRKIRSESLERAGPVDVVIIGGDFVDRRTTLAKLESNILLIKQWKVPIYFIPGNNDHELKGEYLLDVLARHHIRILSNTDEKVELPHGAAFVLSGLDPYFMRPRRSASYLKDRDSYQILCVHDPYVYHQMNREDQKRFNLVLCGHTHGGQIRFFGLGPYQRGGWSQQAKQPLLVSEGYGTSVLPLRLGTRAEYHVIHVQAPAPPSEQDI